MFNNENDSFKNITREEIPYRKVQDRINDFDYIYEDYSLDKIQAQASRCADCGIPFCHGIGCPLGNKIPEMNDLANRGKWAEAYYLLQSTDPFPEFTGRVCPAPCEDSCTHDLGVGSVAIRNIEYVISEKAWQDGHIIPRIPKKRTGKKIGIIGSGPSGLAAATLLNQYGHLVTLFEKDDLAGGFLRYGIPDYKLPKWVVDRRIDLMIEEGIEVITNIVVGEDISVNYLDKQFDAIIVATGSRNPRDLKIEGRDLPGIHFATTYLKQCNQMVCGAPINNEEMIDVNNKNVVVIGGGDTGADCVGNSRRNGAKNIVQIEIMPAPSLARSPETPWPLYAKKLRNSSSHQEGCERLWSTVTKKFIGEKNLEKVLCTSDDKEFELDAQIVLLALGFTHSESNQLFGKLSYTGKVYLTGDAQRGPSLIVHAINDGLITGRQVHQSLI